MIKNRKHVLSQAKESIKNELWGEYQSLLDQKKEVVEEIEKETSSWLEEKLSILNAKIHQAEKDLDDWSLSKYRKKKKSIEWTDDRARKEIRFSKPRKEINWDAAEEVISEKKKIRKNNSSWLHEGTMVVHRSEPDGPPMMVVNVFNEGRTSHVLKDGDIISLRSLSLRPAFED